MPFDAGEGFCNAASRLLQTRTCGCVHMATDGRDVMAELLSKYDKFSALDLDSNNVCIHPKNIRKSTRQQMIQGSKWELVCCSNNSLLLCF